MCKNVTARVCPKFQFTIVQASANLRMSYAKGLPSEAAHPSRPLLVGKSCFGVANYYSSLTPPLLALETWRKPDLGVQSGILSRRQEDQNWTNGREKEILELGWIRISESSCDPGGTLYETFGSIPQP